MKCSLRKLLCLALLCGALCLPGSLKTIQAQESNRSLTTQSTASYLSRMLWQLPVQQQHAVSTSGNWQPLTHDWLDQGYPRKYSVSEQNEPKGGRLSSIIANPSPAKRTEETRTSQSLNRSPSSNSEIDFASQLGIGWEPSERPVPLRYQAATSKPARVTPIPLRPFSLSGFLEDIAAAHLRVTERLFEKDARSSQPHMAQPISQNEFHPPYYGEFESMAGRGQGFEALQIGRSASFPGYSQHYQPTVSESNNTVLERNIPTWFGNRIRQAEEIILQTNLQSWLASLGGDTSADRESDIVEDDSNAWECPYYDLQVLSQPIPAKSSSGAIAWAKLRIDQIKTIEFPKAPRTSLLNSIESAVCGTVWHCYWYEIRSNLEEQIELHNVAAQADESIAFEPAKHWLADSLEHVGNSLIVYSNQLRGGSSGAESTARSASKLR